MKPGFCPFFLAVVAANRTFHGTTGSYPASSTLHDTADTSEGKKGSRRNPRAEDPTLQSPRVIIDEPHRATNQTSRSQCRKFNIDVSVFEKGKECGSPLSSPCFDYSRCRLPPEGPGPTIYVYDFNCTLLDSDQQPTTRKNQDDHHISSYWRKAARKAGVLAETYESACIFLHANDARDPQEPCATKAPLWNDGVNHVMVDFTDNTR